MNESAMQTQCASLLTVPRCPPTMLGVSPAAGTNSAPSVTGAASSATMPECDSDYGKQAAIYVDGLAVHEV